MSKWWKEIDWRCIQMNFREIDMLDVKTEEIIKSLKEFDATVFMINTGGIIASYDTELSFQHQSEFLKSDSLNDIIKACQAENIRVIARMDFSKIREDVFAQHPEWAFRTAQNEVINYNGNISTCLNGGYQQEAVFNILEEVIDTLNIDGFYFNMPGMRVFDYHLNFYGICHCEACKSKYYEEYGKELPTIEGIDFPIQIRDPKLAKQFHTSDMQDYAKFSHQAEQKLTAKLRNFIHEKDPSVAVMDVDYIRSESNEEIDRALPRLAYDSSMNNRMNLGTNQDVVSSNTSVDFLGFSYRHISVSAALQSLRLWQSMANFGGLDYYLIGRMDNHQDKTAFEAIKKVYNFRAEHQSLYNNLVNKAKILLIHTSHSKQPSHEEKGWVMSLTENHVPFAEAHYSSLSYEKIAKYESIICSGNVPRQLISVLKQYVENGGSLLLSGKLSLDPTLKEMAGISNEVSYETDMRTCMFAIDNKDYKDFPSLKGTEVVFFGKTYHKHQYHSTVKKWMTLTKPQRFGPPEMVYGSGMDDYPGFTMNRFGDGKVFYVASDLAAIYFREGWNNTAMFMRDIVLQHLKQNDLSPNLTKMAEVSLGENAKEQRLLVQIVNATGYFGIQVYDSVPLNNVTINVSVSKSIHSVTQVSTGETLHYQIKDNTLVIDIPVVKDYEAIDIQYK